MKNLDDRLMQLERRAGSGGLELVALLKKNPRKMSIDELEETVKTLTEHNLRVRLGRKPTGHEVQASLKELSDFMATLTVQELEDIVAGVQPKWILYRQSGGSK